MQAPKGGLAAGTRVVVHGYADTGEAEMEAMFGTPVADAIEGKAGTVIKRDADGESAGTDGERIKFDADIPVLEDEHKTRLKFHDDTWFLPYEAIELEESQKKAA